MLNISYLYWSDWGVGRKQTNQVHVCMVCFTFSLNWGISTIYNSSEDLKLKCPLWREEHVGTPYPENRQPSPALVVRGSCHTEFRVRAVLKCSEPQSHLQFPFLFSSFKKIHISSQNWREQCFLVTVCPILCLNLSCVPCVRSWVWSLAWAMKQWPA